QGLSVAEVSNEVNALHLPQIHKDHFARLREQLQLAVRNEFWCNVAGEAIAIPLANDDLFMRRRHWDVQFWNRDSRMFTIVVWCYGLGSSQLVNCCDIVLGLP